MTVRTRGTEEYRELSDAMTETSTPCNGDWRFIQERDQIDDAGLIEMRRGCARCPLQPLCRTYADAARPSAGMWAGRYWGRKERSEGS